MGHATQLIPVVISTFRVFQIVIESEVGGGREGILPSGGRNQKFYWEGFFLPGKGNLRRSNFDDSKLKATFHEWWTSIKINMTRVSEEYEIKTKMEQEQGLQLKMLFLLGYNLKIAV